MSDFTKKMRMFCVGSVLLLGGYAFTGVAQEAISTFPYVENFDDAEDYGTLPAGWTTVATGAMKFSVGMTYDFGPGETAQTGTQFLGISSHFDSNREDVAFSPMFEMTAGTEYTMTVWVKSPGTTTNRYPTVKITAGSAQTKETQTTVLAERAEVFSDWTELTYIFTPEANGQYCFGLWYVAGWSSAGNLFYDSFSVTAAATPQTPEVITTFPYTENFDEASEGGMPTGWTAVGDYTFTVQPYYNYGVDPAQSGNQFIVSGYPQTSNRQDIAFSPMMEMTADTEYTMTVWVKMPGIGNSRNPGMKITAGLAPIAEAHGEGIGVVLVERHEVIAAWEKVECKFTPETDGQYCFGLWNCSVLSSAGDVFYDSFSVTTANGSGEEGWKATLPYLETFDDATHYSGEDYLPIGWLATGDETFVTANITGKPAVSGEYYIVARDYIASNRQEIAYSPLLEMEQGTEYQVSLYLYMPGNVSDPSFKLTVGNAQESAAHATVLREVADTRLTDWTRVDATFTPEADGPYCFGLWAVSKESYGGHIAIDNFSITGADQVLPPTAEFYPVDLMQSIITGDPVVFEGQAVKMANLSQNAETYKWTVTGDAKAIVSDTLAAEPTITFPASGLYVVTLKATNATSTAQASQRLNVTVYSEDNPMANEAIQPANDLTDPMFSQNDLPAYDDQGYVVELNTHEVWYDFVVGLTPYYRSIAERFAMPADATLKVTDLTLLTMQYGIAAQNGSTVQDDLDKKYRLKFYPEKDGKPDVANPVFTYEEKIADRFGDDVFYDPVRVSGYDFGDEAPEVTGTFYVALEFDSVDMVQEVSGEMFRTFIGFDTRIHANGQTSFYVMPETTLEGRVIPEAERAYMRADEFDLALKGYCFNVIVWVDEQTVPPTSLPGVDSEPLAVSVSLQGDAFLVKGLESGDQVQVYSTTGARVFSGEATGASMIVPAYAWNSGVYVVTTGSQSVKVVKR